jgi:hypothetical protein
MTNLLSITAAPDTPVACDMTGAEDSLAERLTEYRRLFDHALVERTSTDTSTTFRLADRPGVREWLLDLVRRESACCPFLSFDLDVDGEQVVWRVAGAGASDWMALDPVVPDAADGDSSAALARDLTERTGVPHLVPGTGAD